MILNSHEIGILFELNRQLAIEEGQAALFTASESAYRKAFLGASPLAYGVLAYDGSQTPVGFGVYVFKFATYLSAKVLYIEDLYFRPHYRTQERMTKLLDYIVEQAKSQDCCRIEMRVLHEFNMGVVQLRRMGFKKVTKWDVYRMEIVDPQERP